MRVYRYEHPSDRLGPYRGHHARKTPALDRMDREHSGCPLHPGPFTDFRYPPPGHYVYGFASIADAERWFRGWESALILGGFRLAAYDVPDDHVLRGTYQVAFDPGRATPVPLDPTNTTTDRKEPVPC